MTSPINENPFSKVGEDLIAMGYSAIPILPGEKRPGRYVNGTWVGMSGWQKYCSRLPTQLECEHWSEHWVDAGIGIALGQASGIICIDLDYGSADVRKAIEAVLPPSPVRKKGAKGYTGFYKFNGEKPKKWFVDGESVCELLSHGNQTVVPPTIHPDGMEYRYETEDTLLDYAADELPSLPEDFNAQITVALQPFMDDADRERSGQCNKQQDQVRRGVTARSSNGTRTIWAEINDTALSNLGLWVPQLFPGAKQGHDGSFRVIAHWRGVENANVSIHPDGIMDWGAGKGHTALDIVMLADNCDLESAVESLCERLGIKNISTPEANTVFHKPYYPPVTEPKADALARQKSVIRSWGKKVHNIIEFRRRYRADKKYEHERIELDEGIEHTAAAKGVATKKLKTKYRKEYNGAGHRDTRLAITGSQGSGKTKWALNAIADMPDGIVVILFPTLEKAEEAKSDYEAMRTEHSLPSMVMRGRGKKAENNEPMCTRSSLADRVAKAGLPVSQTLCRSKAGGTCPYFKACLYQAQMRILGGIKDAGRGVVFAAHQYAFTSSLLSTADAVIIDEAIVLKAEAVTAFTPDRITAIAGDWHGVNAGAAANYIPLAKKVRDAIESGQPILKALRDRGITEDDLSTCLEFSSDVENEELGAGPSSSDTVIDESLSRIETTEKVKISALFRQLKLEYHQPRNQANGVTFNPDTTVRVEGKKERQPRVKVHSLKRPLFGGHDIFDYPPLLMPDGTGNIDLIRRVFGADIKHHHIPMERRAEVTQVLGHYSADQRTSNFSTMTFSSQSLTGKNRYGESLSSKREASAKKRCSQIAEIINGFPGDVFVGGTKKVVSGDPNNPGVLNPLLGSNCEAGHFGAIRGLNRHERRKTAVVIGREQPSAEALEDIARCFLGAAAAPFISTRDENGNFSYTLQCRSHRLRGGNGVPELVEVHPDPVAQSILEQIREAEILQTVDRVRAIFNIRRIIILTSVVLDITVDRLMAWKELKALFALERRFPGVLPLRYDVIEKKAPSLVGAGNPLGGKRTAKEILAKIIKSASSQIDIIWKLALFKSGSQKCPSTALFRSNLPNPQAELESLLDEPLVSFTVQPGPDVAALVDPTPQQSQNPSQPSPAPAPPTNAAEAPQRTYNKHDVRTGLGISRLKMDRLIKRRGIRELSGKEKERAIVEAMMTVASPAKVAAFAASLSAP